jgi:SAM-dependent methyltransferase
MVRVLLKKIDRTLFRRLFKYYVNLLEKEIIGSCQTLLDVGCGANSPIKRFSGKLQYSVGVDIFEPSVIVSQGANIHTEYRVMDTLQIGSHFQERSFDCVLASDLIEHLSKEDGLRLIAMMEKIARKKVIIFTPNGFLPQSEYGGNRFQVHLSGWGVEEMRCMGYRVIGVGGWRSLRDECAYVVRRPTLFWERVSLLTQPVIKNYPEYAFQILCVKDMYTISSDVGTT